MGTAKPDEVADAIANVIRNEYRYGIMATASSIRDLLTDKLFD
jgi:stage V sporulation protein SpoVS